MGDKGKVHTSILIPNHRYQTLLSIERESEKKNYLPTLGKLSDLDKELINILQDEHLGDVEKIRQYSKVMSEYLKFQKKLSDQNVSIDFTSDKVDTSKNNDEKDTEKSSMMDSDNTVNEEISNTKLNGVQVETNKEIGKEQVNSKPKLDSKPTQDNKALRREKNIQERDRILMEWLYW